IVLALMIAALGMGTLLSALTVAYRDARHMLPFVVQLWMFATPTIYMNVETFVPGDERWKLLLLPLNPVYGLIRNFRLAMLGDIPDWYSLGVSTGVSILLLAIGCLYFRRVERSFADII